MNFMSCDTSFEFFSVGLLSFEALTLCYCFLNNYYFVVWADGDLRPTSLGEIGCLVKLYLYFA